VSRRARKRARSAAAGEVRGEVGGEVRAEVRGEVRAEVRAAAAAPPRNKGDQSTSVTTPMAPSRSERKNADARAQLVPLREGERPVAVTVAAIVAAILLVVNIAMAVGGYEIHGKRPALPGVIVFTVLLGAMAWGLWRTRYWAVLGMEALLGITMMLFGLALPFAGNVRAVVVSLAVLLPAATLFWFLIRAMARIQMPERR
jgi:hypothetical protein